MDNGSSNWVMFEGELKTVLNEEEKTRSANNKFNRMDMNCISILNYVTQYGLSSFPEDSTLPCHTTQLHNSTESSPDIVA